ncbi:MAG: hypothetical protein QF384_03195, partial [Alphaproteobacteria bacterium]|nr:hypothetical protein [Alphaproteobacteria bacterium]
LSIVATGTSFHFSQVGIRTSVLPTLAFVYDAEKGWFLRNVGNGPALDPIVSHLEDSAVGWIKPTRIYPIETSGRVHLPWVEHGPDKIIVYYKDAHGRSYTSLVDDDRTTIREEDADPVWDTAKEKPVWAR